MSITTARLRFRPFVSADHTWLHPIASDPVVTRYTDWGPNTVDDTTDFLADAATEGAGPSPWTWAVTQADGTGIGSASLDVVSAPHRRARIGYLVGPAHQGAGYGTEIATGLVSRAFDHHGIRRVEATCHPDNTASARVLEKAGLLLEGRMRSHLLARGAWRDSLLFATLDTDPRGGRDSRAP
ncbi:GNAT family N-acetyltransferase [Nocardioides sp. AX2bis]|uniref:GNAT family N-acetyltransferase n=1 Tax=Nocardioides sp. AX2bis TaxID=2653157 RepID=UPI0012F4180A|nr:GNAT family N-acetyltransferase [Nocardioides sp. AX2bis]VXB58265.1 RimJ/RimL family protein N-acetyltransferase [Nocardioides sp. AX2bis]